MYLSHATLSWEHSIKSAIKSVKRESTTLPLAQSSHSKMINQLTPHGQHQTFLSSSRKIATNKMLRSDRQRKNWLLHIGFMLFCSYDLIRMQETVFPNEYTCRLLITRHIAHTDRVESKRRTEIKRWKFMPYLNLKLN